MPPQPANAELLSWALRCLGADLTEEAALEIVAGDASNRRYFRTAVAGRSYILVEAPPQTEKNTEFVAVRDLLAGAGIRVPELFALDLDRGFLLLEDLGDRLLLPQLTPKFATQYYRKAFALLRQLAALDTAGSALGGYDRALLTEEFGRFSQWFVGELLGYTPSAQEQRMLAGFGELLIGSALEQPRVLVHRDFHSRNLMLLAGDELALIDFQDAVYGPISYDLASLLKDCYIRWPSDQVRAWALEYWRDINAEGERAAVTDAQFLRWFEWMGLQRHIKVLGTFARLSLRDGKSHYLTDLPRVLHYVEDTVAQYAGEEPLFAEFGSWFNEKLSPLIDRQTWSLDP